MKVYNTSDDVIIIEFTKDELEACHLTYEKLDSDGLKSKTAICRIITETQKISGESIRISEKTQVDILPDGDGGCLIVLNSRRKTSGFEKLKIYESTSLDGIFDFARSIGKKDKIQSSLFEKDGLYRLVLSAERPVHLLCCEFLSPVGEGETEKNRTEESCICLIPQDALEILGGFGAKK